MQLLGNSIHRSRRRKPRNKSMSDCPRRREFNPIDITRQPLLCDFAYYESTAHHMHPSSRSLAWVTFATRALLLSVNAFATVILSIESHEGRKLMGRSFVEKLHTVRQRMRQIIPYCPAYVCVIDIVAKRSRRI